MPMKQMPVLEVDGQMYIQSVAIARMVGKKVGLGGSDELEDLEIDGVVDTFMDLRLSELWEILINQSKIEHMKYSQKSWPLCFTSRNRRRKRPRRS
jgi:glutathione S-transferase